eukprot:gnl/Spiro4/6693_TR3453_c0_g1_i1.p1 gnl/Spiro4/6693_TR3453_c0_g1~~gnl/Spiro4/6693_TR3453_c0_g1_i1.p1  ORF type:complete len:1250 (+),score=478.14 gnl/Spiro4/6693_TR3453_c0_g1_i1:127-3876(+)
MSDDAIVTIPVRSSRPQSAASVDRKPLISGSASNSQANFAFAANGDVRVVSGEFPPPPAKVSGRGLSSREADAKTAEDIARGGRSVSPSQEDHHVNDSEGEDEGGDLKSIPPSDEGDGEDYQGTPREGVDFGEEAYVPLRIARAEVQRILDSMQGMKNEHLDLIEQIDEHYKTLEAEHDAQYVQFCNSFRDKCANRVQSLKAYAIQIENEAREFKDATDGEIERLRASQSQLQIELQNAIDAKAALEEEARLTLIKTREEMDAAHKQELENVEQQVNERMQQIKQAHEANIGAREGAIGSKEHEISDLRAEIDRLQKQLMEKDSAAKLLQDQILSLKRHMNRQSERQVSQDPTAPMLSRARPPREKKMKVDPEVAARKAELEAQIAAQNAEFQQLKAESDRSYVFLVEWKQMSKEQQAEVGKSKAAAHLNTFKTLKKKLPETEEKIMALQAELASLGDGLIPDDDDDGDDGDDAPSLAMLSRSLRDSSRRSLLDPSQTFRIEQLNSQLAQANTELEALRDQLRAGGGPVEYRDRVVEKFVEVPVESSGGGGSGAANDAELQAAYDRKTEELEELRKSMEESEVTRDEVMQQNASLQEQLASLKSMLEELTAGEGDAAAAPATADGAAPAAAPAAADGTPAPPQPAPAKGKGGRATAALAAMDTVKLRADLNAAQSSKERVDKELANARARISKLEEELKMAKASGGRMPVGGAKGAPSGDVIQLQAQLRQAQATIQNFEKDMKKQVDAALKVENKKIQDQIKKATFTEARLEKMQAQFAQTSAELTAANKELKSAKAAQAQAVNELAALQEVAGEAAELRLKLDEVTTMLREEKRDSNKIREDYAKEVMLRKKYYNEILELKGNIRVFCRCRPMNRRELEMKCQNIIRSPDEMTIQVMDNVRGGIRSFDFDHIYTAESTQESVFEDTARCVNSAIDGYNVCVFAYGQTGSGKTFTMDGGATMPGITPRAMAMLFNIQQEQRGKLEMKFTLYMVELYMDNLRDLLKDPSAPAVKLEIKMEKGGMVRIQGAVVRECNSLQEMESAYRHGSAHRATSATKMNDGSSRSHLITGIRIDSRNVETNNTCKGKLSLVDLAGSEKVAKTGANANTLKEAQSINKSLSALGKVISCLSQDPRPSHIPYRDNKLTQVMQDSLGGDAKTLMFVNISPADDNRDETITSLVYAQRVKAIVNNASRTMESAKVAQLKAVIKKLRAGIMVADEDLASDDGADPPPAADDEPEPAAADPEVVE